MGCSRPNQIGIGGLYENSTFLGPKTQEKGVHDLGNLDSIVHDIPCGKCDLCLVTRRYDKALRIMLEAESWPDKATFITLTHEKIDDPNLNHKDWSQFIKNFRQTFCQTKYCDISKPKHWKAYGKIRSHTHKEIKQVMCGEYGDDFGRKHFHGIIFNHSFSDMRFTGNYSKKGNPIYTSDELQKVWKKGIVQIAPVTFDLALYVGSYVTDLGDEEDVNEGKTKPQYGLFGRGIGLNWFNKYYKDVLAAGKIMMHDKDYPVPRYFWKKLEQHHPEIYTAYKQKKYRQLQEQKERLIKKGDGPLRRAQAKGRIFQSIHSKKELSNGANSEFTVIRSQRPKISNVRPASYDREQGTGDSLGSRRTAKRPTHLG